VTSLTGGQTNFAHLAVSYTGTLYIHFQGLLPPDRILPGAKFTLRPRLGFSYIGSITAWHSSSGRQPNFVAWYKEWNYGTFTHGATYIGWAAISCGFYLLLPFFPSLFSVVADWMTTLFPHMMWP